MTGKDRICKEAAAIAAKYEGKDAFGNGFLWVLTRAGNSFVAAYVTEAANHSDICREVKSEVVGVQHAWINLD